MFFYTLNLTETRPDIEQPSACTDEQTQHSEVSDLLDRTPLQEEPEDLEAIVKLSPIVPEIPAQEKSKRPRNTVSLKSLESETKGRVSHGYTANENWEQSLEISYSF